MRDPSLSKNLVEFRRRGGEKSPIIFFDDMCGEENTVQAASVKFVRRRLAYGIQARITRLSALSH